MSRLVSLPVLKVLVRDRIVFGPGYNTMRSHLKAALASASEPTLGTSISGKDSIGVPRQGSGYEGKPAGGNDTVGCDGLCWWRIRSMVSLHVSTNENFRWVT